MGPKVGAIEEPEDSEVGKVRMQIRTYQVFAALFVVLGLLFSSPVGRRERMPSPVFAQWHLLGTWSYLAICICLGQAYLNNEGNQFIYRHASASTMVVYIFHWMFLKLFAVWVFDSLDKCKL